MRTQQEILDRIAALKPNDWLGFKTTDLILALTYENAKPYLKPDCTAEAWDSQDLPRTPEAFRDVIRDYLPFAWEKANNERGISSERSIDHFRSWIWLAGDDAVLAKVDAAPYPMYGKPKLKVITRVYGREGGAK